MTNQNFESSFKTFVKEFGGEVLLENSKNQIADYLFRNQNIVAELKCLTEDHTDAMNTKVAELLRAWVRKHKKRPTEDFLSISTTPKEIQIPWLNFLRGLLENFVKKANRQIRETKKQHNLPTAKGLLLVFNEGNPLHNRPEDFHKLMESVIRKKDPEKQRRFESIHGWVYFSFETVKTQKENMNFWYAAQVQTDPNDNEELMAQFQNDLQQAWYAYLHKTTGKIIRQHKR